MIILVPQTRREILETRGVVAKNPQTKRKDGTIVMEVGKMRHTRSSCTTIEKDGEISSDIIEEEVLWPVRRPPDNWRISYFKQIFLNAAYQ